MKAVQKLLIIGRVNHYWHAGQFHSFAPYAREIDIWADLFPEVVIASTLREEAPPREFTAFTRKNITVVPVADVAGTTFRGRLIQAFRLPKMIWQLIRYMRQADAIHIRCPSDLGLLGALLAPLFSRRRVAKYATHWMGFAGEPLAWRCQRAVLRSRWWRSPVTVYGQWPNQPKHVVPFFTSVLTEAQIARARAACAHPRPTDVVRVLFVGRLTKSKNCAVLLEALASARTGGVSLEGVFVGDGPEREALMTQAQRLGLAGHVKFTGGLAFEEVLNHYEQSHVLVLASEIEGWPKAIGEGMAFGLVCIGSARGMVPQMLADGRGLLVQPGDVRGLTTALQQVANDSAGSARMAECAAAWSQQYSLEGLREALRKMLEEHWQ